jgi:hypothetical protein
MSTLAITRPLLTSLPTTLSLTPTHWPVPPFGTLPGNDDPFHPGVVALAKALPAHAVALFVRRVPHKPFFVAQEPPSLAFLAENLTP